MYQNRKHISVERIAKLVYYYNIQMESMLSTILLEEDEWLYMSISFFKKISVGVQNLIIIFIIEYLRKLYFIYQTLYFADFFLLKRIFLIGSSIGTKKNHCYLFLQFNLLSIYIYIEYLKFLFICIYIFFFKKNTFNL